MNEFCYTEAQVSTRLGRQAGRRWLIEHWLLKRRATSTVHAFEAVMFRRRECLHAQYGMIGFGLRRGLEETLVATRLTTSEPFISNQIDVSL